MSDAAAAVLNGFEGVALDAEAEAAIAAALEACAARAREIDAACEAGGDVAAAAEAAADDPESEFVRVAGPCYLGELEPPAADEFVPFTPGEAPWRLAGAEMPEELARWQAERPFETPSAPQDERPFETPSAPQDEREGPL